jgi:hypothetical protein
MTDSVLFKTNVVGQCVFTCYMLLTLLLCWCVYVSSMFLYVQHYRIFHRF